MGTGLDCEVTRDAYVTGLPTEKVSRARSVLGDSERFSVDETGYILLRPTEMPVGFLGSDSLELCFPENVNELGMMDLRKAHSLLMSVYSLLI